MRRVAVTGASGLIGTALTAALEKRGDRVVPIGRHPPDGGVAWDLAARRIDGAALDGYYVTGWFDDPERAGRASDLLHDLNPAVVPAVEDLAAQPTSLSKFRPLLTRHCMSLYRVRKSAMATI